MNCEHDNDFVTDGKCMMCENEANVTLLMVDAERCEEALRKIISNKACPKSLRTACANMIGKLALRWA